MCAYDVITLYVPYKGLINVFYGLKGYLGFILVFFMIIYDMKMRGKKEKENWILILRKIRTLICRMEKTDEKYIVYYTRVFWDREKFN